MPDPTSDLDFGSGEGGPNQQVYQPNLPAIAPRHGRLVLTDGSNKWFDIERSRRWPAAAASQYFGQALYLTANGNWVLYAPGTDISPATVLTQTAAQAVAFLLREGHQIPATLLTTAQGQEV